MIISVLVILSTAAAFLAGIFVCAYITNSLWFEKECEDDEDCGDEDEETGSPYRRNCIPVDPERQFDKDGGRPKPAPLKKSLSDEINGVEILALQNAVERLKRSAIEHANGGWMGLYQDDMENLRKYQKRLEKLV